ncbi:ATP-binding protein [Bacillus sporothermodurans]|uniref:AAA family ATPase n=2 Tax=Heyndrickxia sporothermodurans TaxID=46224 RepID=UPI00192C1B1A|nr:ATP-binding protein [Heyndrickxia sporothermodurans]MBL5807949.1 ATP-binding protein [Heyndrickxia sporothermodurans]MBL5857821.1 ATP-binding protein [Heyndrickxia sporothermodurans]
MMAKGSYLKKLFQSFNEGNTEEFKAIAKNIIDDERKKNHYQLADELQRIINSTSLKQLRKAESNFNNNLLHLLPKDKDSNFNLVDVKTSKILLDDLILDEFVSTLLKDFIREYEGAEILESYGLKPRNRYLFCGPPGCGKTVTAEAIAGELNIPILYTRFDSIVSSYLGETASNLRKIFDFIEKGTWILFFDEFDAISKQRDSVDEHGELKRVVNTFLQLLDNYNGDSIIIAATNHQNLLDQAVWRRFDEVIMFDKPKESQITELLRKNLKRYPCSEINFVELSKGLVGYAHADIERIILNTIRTAIIENDSYVDDNKIRKQMDIYRERAKIYNKIND